MAETHVGPRWADLTRRQRTRAVAGTVASVALTWIVMFGLYYLVPFTDRASRGALVRLFVGIAGFIVVLAFQLRQIKNAELPILRAVQALSVAVGLFLVVFAALYLSLAEGTPGSFSEELNHTGALYLTITVFSTVGFGDITPETDFARIVVALQMLLDLIVIGAVVRLLVNAAKSASRREG